MIRRLWRLLGGYVIIKVKGADLERFINRTSRAGVALWDTERIGSGMLVASLSISDFRKVRVLCRAQGWKVAIADKVGLPFLFAALFRRKLLVAGGLVAAAAIYAASTYVWFVQVEGEAGLPVDEIVAVAAKEGLRPGVPREAVDRDEVQKALLLEIDDLGWASVSLEGTRAVIRAAERTSAEAASERPGDVVAARDGLIENVTVFRGHPLVEAGDTVKRGDVLISGFIPPGQPEHERLLQEGKAPYVRADGIVKARVWYEGRATVRLVREEVRPTGVRSRGVELSFGSATWRIGRPPQEPYRTDRATWSVEVAGRNLSIGWVVYEEVTRRLIAVSEDEARVLALEAARAQLEAMVPENAERVSDPVEEVEIVEGEGAPVLVATVRAEVVEDIKALREIEP